MPIPDFQTLMKPVLVATADGNEHITRELIDEMSGQFELSPEERAQRLPSGRQAVMANRVHWAIAYLSKCGLIERPARATYRITARGREALAEQPERIDLAFLARYPELAQFQRGEGGAVIAVLPAELPQIGQVGTPDERIDAALREIDAALREALLDRILSSSPAFFERLVIELLVRMGYGGSRADAAQHLGGPNDGGVDGVIKLDKLGLDLVYIQAKRNNSDNVVGRPTVQAFAGALDGHGATRGVFITTSYFSAEAQAFVETIRNKQIALIDGDALARLLVEHDVGVREDRHVVMRKLDDDFFEE